jgi:uncharacterized protein YjbI with pentapeptide repeats
MPEDTTKPTPPCDRDQYEMLKRCSDKRDCTEWNKWREKNPSKQILLMGASLNGFHLENANLFFAHLKNAELAWSYLKGASLEGAILQGATLGWAQLQSTKLRGAHLEGANLGSAQLEDAQFEQASVDKNTIIWNCTINENVVFNGEALKNARVEPELAQLLEYNIRRKRWQDWYKEHLILK